DALSRAEGHRRCHPPPPPELGECGGRRLVLGQIGRDARPCRRIRLWKDDHRAERPASGGDRGGDYSIPGEGYHENGSARVAPPAPPNADDLSGSVRVVGPALFGGAYDRGASDDSRDRRIEVGAPGPD